MNNIRIYVRQMDHMNPWGVSLCATARDSNGGLYLPKPIEFEKIDHESITLPQDATLIHLDNSANADTLQGLMDSLWQAGVRPRDVGTPGHLAATTKHLEDMRTIAFSRLDLQPPTT